MSDPVDVGALAEARDSVMANWMAQRPANVRDLKPLLDLADAVLEAPTAEWCEMHGSPDVICKHSAVCKIGWVRLVAESQPDQPT